MKTILLLCGLTISLILSSCSSDPHVWRGQAGGAAVGAAAGGLITDSWGGAAAGAAIGGLIGGEMRR